MANREIAQALFATLRTAETDLIQTYQKLDSRLPGGAWRCTLQGGRTGGWGPHRAEIGYVRGYRFAREEEQRGGRGRCGIATRD
jgi:hypothetical protein